MHAERKRALYARVAGRLRIETLAERVRRGQERLAAVWRVAETLSYKNVLARGFALVADAEGRPVRGAAQVASGAALTIEFQDGKIGAIATGGGAEPRPKRAAKPKPSTQESLF